MTNLMFNLRAAVRLRSAALGLAIMLGPISVQMILVPMTTHAAAPAPLQSFNSAGVSPRPVEDTTSASIQRDYAHAWKSLVVALEENRTELLNENFTGTARQQWQEAIHTQKQNGLSRRIVDHGHSVRVTFYSLDGSALEATDTADLEIQYREGGKVISTERVQAHYLVLLTPAENSWKLRMLQEVPAN
ncbi:MAG TPA: hypothetical protein VM578_03180 [Candidatus Saccharimonadales bacterium]|nr:hypothetical protein [Candidatus Saccharimonadales bacterium]